MRLQPPFPPFFLRGLGRCRRCGDGGSRGPGGVPRPSAFAAAGRLCRRGRSRVGGVFRRCGGGGFVPGGFRGVAGALLRGLPARRVGGAGGGFSGRLDGRSRCGTRAPSATRARRAGSRPGLGLRRILRRLRRLRGIAGGLLLRVAGRPLRRLLSGVRIPGGTLCGFGSGVPGRFRLLGAGGTLCGLLRGAALRRAYSGAGPSVGIVSPVSFWMSQRYSNSSSEQNDHAAPSCPARPVRPMRWT